jgi:hypothetical protein
LLFYHGDVIFHLCKLLFESFDFICSNSGHLPVILLLAYLQLPGGNVEIQNDLQDSWYTDRDSNQTSPMHKYIYYYGPSCRQEAVLIWKMLLQCLGWLLTYETAIKQCLVTFTIFYIFVIGDENYVPDDRSSASVDQQKLRSFDRLS